MNAFDGIAWALDERCADEMWMKVCGLLGFCFFRVWVVNSMMLIVEITDRDWWSRWGDRDDSLGKHLPTVRSAKPMQIQPNWSFKRTHQCPSMRFFDEKNERKKERKKNVFKEIPINHFWLLFLLEIFLTASIVYFRLFESLLFGCFFFFFFNFFLFILRFRPFGWQVKVPTTPE